MAIIIRDITTGSENWYAVGVYVTIPEGIQIEEIVDSFPDLKFGLSGTTPAPFAKWYENVLEVEGSFVDVLFIHRELNHELYDINRVDSHGRKTLHIRAVGNSLSAVRCIVRELLGKYKGIAHLSFKPRKHDYCANGLDERITEVRVQKGFFDEYLAIRSLLGDLERLPTMDINQGAPLQFLAFLYDIGKSIINPAKSERRLVHRVRGTYSLPVQLSMLHLANIHINGITGVFVQTEFEEGCVNLDSCDRSRSYAGYLFDTDEILYGTSIQLIDVAGSCPCQKKMASSRADSEWHVIARGVRQMPRGIYINGGYPISLPDKHIDEMETLVKLVYDARQRNTR